MQNPEKKQDFRVTLPLGGRDGDRQGSILREASREQQGPQELSSAFPAQLCSPHCCTSLHEHHPNHREFYKANASVDFRRDLFSPSLRLICQHSLASRGNILYLLQPANSQSVALFPAGEGAGQAWALTHNILKLSVACP